MRRAALASLCVLSVVGCEVTGLPDGGGGGTGGGGGARPDAGATALSVDAFCAAFTEASCESGVRCGVYESVDGCRTLLGSRRAVDLCATGRAAVSDGRAQFDGVAAKACLAQLASRCGAEPCLAVFTGQVPADGGCYFTAFNECSGGGLCDTSSTCPARCQPRGGAGAFVESANLCDPDTYAVAVFGDAGFVLRGYSCEPRKPLSARCSSGECAVDLTCNPETTRCEAVRQEGESCTAADGGALGGGFFGGVCDTRVSLSCTPTGSGGFSCQKPRGLEQPCGFCKADLQCGAPDGGRPRCVPLGTVGQFCANVYGCIDDSFCKPAPGSGAFAPPGTCAARARLNEPCVNGDSCEAGLTCTPQPRDGGLLGSDFFCRQGMGPSPVGLACVDAP